METMHNQSYEVVECCLLAGEIMLQNGAETYRVEDTMKRIAAAFGVLQSEVFVMPTGIILSIDSSKPITQLVRVSERSTDLFKVTKVNSISRQISAGELTVEEAKRRLKKVGASTRGYSLTAQVIASAIASGCFLIMFQGGWRDFLPAAVAGGLGFAALVYLHRLVELKFFAELLSSFIIGLVAYLFVMSGLGHELDKIIIGSVMPLVPGLLITNAVRDLMAGHLVSGLSKGAEAILTSFAIGAGVAVVLSLFS